MRQRLLVAFALSALAIAARLPDVWRLALSQDEVASARALREPTLVGAVHRIVRTESTPPLWHARGWTLHHTGNSLVGVRLLSVASGRLLAAAVFFIARAVAAPPYA